MENILDTIYAEMRLDYIYRNVVKKEKTFPEWDDRIRYINGVVTRKIPILTAKDYVPGFCCIGAVTGGEERELIRLESPDEKDHTIIFRSSGEAIAFYEWLDWYFRRTENKKKGIKIGIYAIKYGETELTESIFLGEPSIEILPYYF